MRLLAALWIALCCTACVNSPDINTPREIITDGGSLATSFAISVKYNNNTQVMELIDNLFRCEVSESSDGTVVSLRVELQNIRPPAGNYINSVYFRADALPVDGVLHSLSGDPTTSNANAAKLLVYESGQLLPIVPLQTTGTQDNFLVSVVRIQGQRKIQGWFICNTVLPSRTAELTGEFTIAY